MFKYPLPLRLNQSLFGHLFRHTGKGKDGSLRPQMILVCMNVFWSDVFN